MRKSTISIGLALGLLLSGAEAFAQNSAQEEQFSKLMMDGVMAYRQGAQDSAKYEEAIKAFEQAYEIQKNPDILYNIGRCYHMLNKCSNALEKYREYALLSPENAKSVKTYIDELDAQCGVVTGEVTLTCVPESATLLIDGVAQTACSGSHSVDTGTHKLSFLADGYLAETREITLSRDKSKVSLTVGLQRAPLQEQVNPTDDAPQKSPNSPFVPNAQAQQPMANQAVASTALETKPSIMFWGAVGASGAGVVLLITGGSLIGSGYRNNVSFNGAKRDYLYQRNSGRVVGGGVLLGLGAAVALSGIGLFVADMYLNRLSTDDSTAQVSVVPSIGFSGDGAAASVTMTF